MLENLDKALELWTDSETCEFIKKNNLGKSLSLYLSRILINLVECININDPSFEMRLTLIRFLSILAQVEMRMVNLILRPIGSIH